MPKKITDVITTGEEAAGHIRNERLIQFGRHEPSVDLSQMKRAVRGSSKQHIQDIVTAEVAGAAAEGLLTSIMMFVAEWNAAVSSSKDQPVKARAASWMSCSE